MKRSRRGRRGNGEGGVYQLPDGSWRASHTIELTPSGKPKRVYRVRKSRASAIAAIEAFKNGTEKPRRNAKPVAIEKTESKPLVVEHAKLKIDCQEGTTGHLLQTWLALVSKDLAENSIRSYSNAINKHLIPKIGQIPPDRLDIETIETALGSLVVGEQGKRTRQNVYVVLSAALNKGVKWKRLAVNPCDEIAKPTAKRKDIHPFTLQESQHFLKTVTGAPRDEALYRLALTTGMRQGELFGLHREAIDLEAGTVHIYQQATEVWGELRVSKPKSRSSIRKIDLTPTVVACLRDHFKWLDDNGFEGNPIVFPNQDGKYLRRGTFSRWSWKKWLKAAQLAHRGFHHLRHTFATLMLINGVEIPVVTQILGHGSQKTTLDIYGHVLPGRRSDACRKMATLLDLPPIST